MHSASPLVIICSLLACDPASHNPLPTSPGPAVQTAGWSNPNKDAIWATSWTSAGDATFTVDKPYDGDFYITSSGHLTTDITQALTTNPPLDGKPWEVKAQISGLVGGQVLSVTFMRCEPELSYCASTPIGEVGLSAVVQVDTWPNCTLAMKVAGVCFLLQQGTEGVVARLRYTPKIHISIQGEPLKLGSLFVSLSMQATAK